MSSDPVIPPPSEADKSLDLLLLYHVHSPTDGLLPKDALAIIRRCHAAESALTAIRELCRPMVGREPCPRCTGRGDHIIYCSLCSGSGTVDVADGLTTEECVRRVVARLQDEVKRLAVDYQREHDRCNDFANTVATKVQRIMALETEVARLTGERDEQRKLLTEARVMLTTFRGCIFCLAWGDRKRETEALMDAHKALDKRLGAVLNGQPLPPPPVEATA